MKEEQEDKDQKLSTHVAKPRSANVRFSRTSCKEKKELFKLNKYALKQANRKHSIS